MSLEQQLNSDLESKLAQLERQYNEKCRTLKSEYELTVRRETENFRRLTVLRKALGRKQTEKNV